MARYSRVGLGFVQLGSLSFALVGHAEQPEGPHNRLPPSLTPPVRSDKVAASIAE
jgi:hypothetical protein